MQLEPGVECLLPILIGYILGSIPFGYVIVKALRRIDIREYGSHNIGATNVWRSYGRGYGVPIVVKDNIHSAGLQTTGVECRFTARVMPRSVHERQRVHVLDLGHDRERVLRVLLHLAPELAAIGVVLLVLTTLLLRRSLRSA
mgnify:CR=1 FL=1